jgi:hypothetical protein
MTSVAATKARNIKSAAWLWGAGAAARGKEETILDNEKDEILRNERTGRVFRVRRE